MGSVLWTSAEDGVDLGDPFKMYATIGRLQEIAGPDGEKVYGDLYEVPEYVEAEDLSPTLLKDIGAQAQSFLSNEQGLGDQEKWFLTQLAPLAHIGWSPAKNVSRPAPAFKGGDWTK